MIDVTDVNSGDSQEKDNDADKIEDNDTFSSGALLSEYLSDDE